MPACTIGLDFGTLSGRALLVDTRTGRELASASRDYSHGVLDKALPDGTALPPDWALQHPGDYREVLEAVIPAVIREAGVAPRDIVGIGVDFTASTLLPVKADGTPLCFLEAFASNPHAWPKLWKHHAPQAWADRITEVARERREPWLGRYGGRVSSEWHLPKVLETLDQAPEVYEAADYFIEAGDWLVWRLCGVLAKSAGIAGYKCFWHSREGYPSPAFFRALDPRLEHYPAEKLGYPMARPGERLGGVTGEMAAATGLAAGTAVSPCSIDAHVTVPAAGILEPGTMLAIMGTSTCHLVLGEEERQVPGICGVVEGGAVPGLWAYEAGQSCVGDHFAWFIESCLPEAYAREARALGLSLHQLLRQKAERLAPGESGLLALDWWNGNRSVLVDMDLTGLLIGMTLQTRPEEIYRALIEATAFGTRRILENFRDHGVGVRAFTASGGIARKDPMTMQIYADVIGLPVQVAGASQGSALGSAIFGAVAAGASAGGYGGVRQAAAAMGARPDRTYEPIPANRAVYDRLYEEYGALHDYFGRGGSDAMKRLKAIKKEAGRRKEA